MTLRLLKILTTVYECNSITKAAEKLFVAQPSVSIAIQQLENYYAVQLFVRNNKRLVPTEQCKLLYNYAKQTLKSFELFEQTATEHRETENINIGASVTTGKYIVPALLRYADDFLPLVRLTVTINQRHTITDMLKKGELDIALISGSSPEGNFEVQTLTPDRIVMVKGVNYPLPDKPDLPLLARQRWILREQGSASRDFWEKYTKAHGFDIQPYISSSSTQMIVQCICDNLGIGVLPYSLVKSKIQQGELQEIKLSDEVYQRQHHILISKQAKNKKYVADLVAQCHRLAQTINS